MRASNHNAPDAALEQSHLDEHTGMPGNLTDSRTAYHKIYEGARFGWQHLRIVAHMGGSRRAARSPCRGLCKLVGQVPADLGSCRRPAANAQAASTQMSSVPLVTRLRRSSLHQLAAPSALTVSRDSGILGFVHTCNGFFAVHSADMVYIIRGSRAHGCTGREASPASRCLTVPVLDPWKRRPLTGAPM